MKVDELYRSKLRTADEAVAGIVSGNRVLVGSGCAEPQTLVRALLAQSLRLNDVEIVHLLTLGIADYVQEGFMDRFRHNAFFIGANVREAVSAGRADYTPIFLSEIPHLMTSGQRPVDAVLLQVTPPIATASAAWGCTSTSRGPPSSRPIWSSPRSTRACRAPSATASFI